LISLKKRSVWVKIILKSMPLLYAFLGRFISSAGVLGLSVLLSQQLSLEEAGKFFGAFAALMGIAIFLRSGQELLLIRKIAQDKDEPESQSSLFMHSLATVFCLSLVAVIILYAYYFTGEETPSPLSELWKPILPVTLINLAAAYMKGQGRSGMGGLYEVGLISMMAFLVFLVAPPTDAHSSWRIFTWVAWITFLISIGMAILRAQPSISAFRPQASLLFEARHLWAFAVLSYLSQWGGLLVVAALVGSESVAILNALFRLLAPIQFVIITLDFFLAPKFSIASGREINRLRNLGIVASLAIAFPYIGFLLVAPNFVLWNVFGADYAAYSTELRILVVSSFVTMAIGANGILLNMCNKEKAVIVGVLGRSLVSVFLTLVLINYISLTAAVLGFALALVMQNLFYRIYANYTLTELDEASGA